MTRVFDNNDNISIPTIQNKWVYGNYNSSITNTPIEVTSSYVSPDEKNTAYENLLRQRRVILETAEGKIKKLDKLLEKELEVGIKYTLIYTSDKKPEQMEQVKLDDFIEKNDYREIIAIKIDVDGNDLKVLFGAKT